MKRKGRSPGSVVRPDAAPDQLLEGHEHFTGREWAVDRIENFTRHGQGQMLAVVAKPGAGKTSLAVRVTQIARGERQAGARLRVHATHFCQAQVISSLDAVEVLQHLSGQLAATVPGYADVLQHVGAAPDVRISARVKQRIGHAGPGAQVTGMIWQVTFAERDPRLAFEALLRRPLAVLRAEGRLREDVVVLLDGLDEAVEASSGALLNVLAAELSDPVPGPVPALRWVVFTRPENVLPRLAGVTKQVFDLAADQPEGVDDLLAYAQARLGHLAVPGSEFLARQIAEAAGGSFLYAHHVIQEVLERDPMPSGLAGIELPKDLADVYRRFLNRKIGLPGSLWQDRFRPVLGALTQARGDGLSYRHLLAITGLAAPDLDDTLRDCGPYLVGDPDRGLMVHHQSLRDYLRETGPHYIYPADASGAILAALAPGPPGRRRWDEADRHILEYGIQYALDAARTADLITDPGFLIHADPAAVMPALDRYQGNLSAAAASAPTSSSSQLAVAVYRSCAHLLTGQSPAARRQLLALYAAQWQDQDLAAAIENTPVPTISPRVLTVTWATGSWLPRGQLGVLAGHTGKVTGVTLSELNGVAIAVTTSDDGTARVWDLTRRTQIGLFSERMHRVTQVVLGHLNGNLIAVTVGKGDDVARVWDLATCTEIGFLGEQKHTVTKVVLGNVDGNPIAVTIGSLENAARVWDLATCTQIGVLTGDARWVGDVVLGMVDGTSIAVTLGYPENIAHVWDLATYAQIGVLNLTIGRVFTGNLNDTPIAITTDEHGTLQVMTLGTWIPIGVLTGHTKRVISVALGNLGSRPIAVSIGDDHTVRVWDLFTWTQIGMIRGDMWWEDFITIGELDGLGIAVTGTFSGTAEIWDLSTCTQLGVITGHRGRVTSARLGNLNDMAVAVTTSSDRTARIWDLSVITKAGRSTGHTDRVTGVALGNMNGTPIAVTTSEDQTIRVWELDRGTQLNVLTGHTDEVTSVALSTLRSVPIAVTTSHDGTVRVWDLADGLQLGVLASASARLAGVALGNMNGTPIAVTTGHGRVAQVWDLSAGPGREVQVRDLSALRRSRWQPEPAPPVELGTLTGHTGLTAGVAVGEMNGSPIAVTTSKDILADSRYDTGPFSEDTTVRIWDLTTYTQIGVLLGHQSWVTSVALGQLNGSPIAVTTSEDRTARVWDLSTQTQLGVFAGHTSIVSGVALGDLNGVPVAVTTSWDGTAQVWDLSSQMLYEVLRVAEQSAHAIAIADGRMVVTFGRDIAVYNFVSSPHIFQ